MERIGAKELKEGLRHAFASLDAHKSEINALNVFPVPDGDTGTNMTLTMKSAIDMVEEAADTIPSVSKALGSGSLLGARGNSGVILSQLCRGMAQSLKDKETILLRDLPEVFEAARAKAYKAVMQPTEGTILTIARVMSEFAAEHDGDYASIEAFLKDILRYANYMLQKTPEMLPELKEAGVVDAGGQGLVYLMSGFIEGLTGEDLSDLLSESKRVITHAERSEEGRLMAEKNERAYYLEFDIEAIEKDRLLRHLHDGVLHSLEAKNGGFHVELYTDAPLRILVSQFKRGKISEARLVQSREHQALDSSQEETDATVHSAEPEREFGFVAVSLGEGFEALFHDLMVDEVVAGGQTMNPSTRDLYEAVERVPARQVFLLPNNKNIILAAEQVQELTKKVVHVIPTRSMPEGVCALFHFNEAVSGEENAKEMTDSLKQILTGQITYAVRDTEIHGLPIHEGDRIGLMGGTIVASGDNDEDLMLRMIDESLDAEYSLLTVYTGEEISQDQADAMESKIHQRWPELEVEFTVGGQPLYSYIFSLE